MYLIKDFHPEYEEFLQLNTKKSKNSLKNGQNSDRNVTKRDVQMSNEHMKKCKD